jgi:hypothetical protein
MSDDACFRHRTAINPTDVLLVVSALPPDAPEAMRDAAMRLRAYLGQRKGEPPIASLIRHIGGRVTTETIQRVGQYADNSANVLLTEAIRRGHVRRVGVGLYMATADTLTLPEAPRG